LEESASFLAASVCGDIPRSGVLGIFNATTMNTANYIRTDPPPLLRVWEFFALAVAFSAYGGVARRQWYGALSGRRGDLFHDGVVQPHDVSSTLESTCGTRAGRRSRAKRLEEALVTIRFGEKVRLASRDRSRLREITLRDPGNIDSFEALQNFLEWHRARVRGKSKDAEFLRWLMGREWKRLAPRAGY
jgi:hypothetical protein